MKRSTDRILTTHVGSLPRPGELIAVMRAVERGEPYDQEVRATLVRQAVAEAVRKQIEHGVDVINDGEMGKPGFINYANDRLGGFERAQASGKGLWSGTRETNAFPEFYNVTPSASASTSTDKRLRMVCTGPITYKGQPYLRADIEILKTALKGEKFAEVFLPSVSPALLAGFQRNAYYRTDEEFVYAIAEAMREDYKMIVDAGFILQIDDPGLLAHYLRNPSLSMDNWLKWSRAYLNFRVGGHIISIKGERNDRQHQSLQAPEAQIQGPIFR